MKCASSKAGGVADLQKIWNGAIQSLSRLFPVVVRDRAEWRATAQATQRLVRAYRATFGGIGTREDSELVISDLAEFTGYYQVTDSMMPDNQVRYAEGRRSVMGHVLNNLRLTEGELVALEESAREEAIAQGRARIG